MILPSHRVSTRVNVRIVALLACACVFAGCRSTHEAMVGPTSVVTYVLACAQPGGGFGECDIPARTLCATSHAISILKLCDLPVPQRDSCSAFMLSADVSGAKDGWARRARMRSLASLGKEVPWRDVAWIRNRQRADGGWSQMGGSSDLVSTCHAIEALASIGAVPLRPKAAAQFVVDRLHVCGVFLDVPRRSSGVEPSPSGHVQLTFLGVRALKLLGYEIPWRSRIAAWLRRCQNADGGFVPNPAATDTLVSSGGSDIWYTMLAVRALWSLGVPPTDSAGAVAFVNACQNADGGFGDRPGVVSSLAATDRAVSTLAALCGDPLNAISVKSRDLARMVPWRGDTLVFHLYAGPSPVEPIPGRRSPWSPGLPVYLLPDSLEAALQYLRSPGVGIGDTVLTDPVWQIPFQIRNDTAGIVLFVQSPLGADSLARFHRTWTRARGQARLEDRIRTLSAGIGEIGGAVCVVPKGLTERADYQFMDHLFVSPPDMLTARYSSGSIGTELSAPWLLRLFRRFPMVVPIGSRDGQPADCARLVWFGTVGTFTEMLMVLRDGGGVCAMNDATNTVLHGDPAAAARLAAKPAVWRWW
jgi:prenyltransferase beta subunit